MGLFKWYSSRRNGNHALTPVRCTSFCRHPTFTCNRLLSTGVLYASQNDVGGAGNFAAVYDNFQIFQNRPYYLDDVEWFGGYFNGAGNAITGWTISIYADAGMQPGGLLWSRNFSVAYSGYMESLQSPEWDVRLRHGQHSARV